MIVMYAAWFASGFLLLFLSAVSIARGDYGYSVVASLFGSLLLLLAIRGVISQATGRNRP